VTYSIIGRDAETGEIGIAVQSRWFHAGQDLAWIQPAVGAVCTQAITDPSYGPRGLELLQAGKSPREAIDELTAADPGLDVRQVAIASADGDIAQHTGAACVAAAGHASGSTCCAQGNMLASDTCWGAMVEAFERASGPLPDRLLAALEAAEREGGDARGRQAGRLLVCGGRPTGAEWEDRVVDLQVVDHPRPVEELARLLRLQRAYARLSSAFQLVRAGNATGAAAEVDAAAELAPEDDQIAFWRATILAPTGRVDEAAAAFREAVRAHPAWPDFLRRCVAAGLVPPGAEALATQARSPT
jgi:uncharacterized Ntn-hydrolase superfamily protein